MGNREFSGRIFHLSDIRDGRSFRYRLILFIDGRHLENRMTVRKGIPRLGKHRKEPDFGAKCSEVVGSATLEHADIVGPPQNRIALWEEEKQRSE
jgi:hypothetical protein